MNKQIYPQRRTKFLTFKRKSSEIASSAILIVFMIFLNLQSNFDDSRGIFVVHACRLPWSATAESVAKFFSGKSYQIF